MIFNDILAVYRKTSFSERHKGERFERLMRAYLLTDPMYAAKWKELWLWNDFPGKKDLGGKDTGIDLVGLTKDGDYWAIQCKCFDEKAIIDKPSVDSFMSTSSRTFLNEAHKTVRFTHRLWISTTNKFGNNALAAFENQDPPCSRISLSQLQDAPVDWTKLESGLSGAASRSGMRALRPHQQEAIDKAVDYFAQNVSDRGKLIMACGTGKTFTSLKLAETLTENKGLVLFLVPSIALLGQTLREWSAFAEKPINAICICSDAQINKGKNKDEDSGFESVVDLALPASTNEINILRQFNHLEAHGKEGMTVVFSTYQSIETIEDVQGSLFGQGKTNAEFDLIICDEAHRTTGVILDKDYESAFTRVHDNNNIKAKKRIYMTATPRLYKDDVKEKAKEKEVELCSMDDPALYGHEIYRIGFGEAVDKGLLSDYKVLVLTVNENDIPAELRKVADTNETIITDDDLNKLVGCMNALSKQLLYDEGVIQSTDPEPMRRGVAFCSNIKNSKAITDAFNETSVIYRQTVDPEIRERLVHLETKHIDGTFAAPARDELLSWLKEETGPNECRVLNNVRCLSEGVDVPSLDAVMFLSSRNSQVDVVQSVGRVMRLSPGKKYGYIIIPIFVPANVAPETALQDNDKYKVVWTVLNALRAHDDRFNAEINKIDLNKKSPGGIVVGAPGAKPKAPKIGGEQAGSNYDTEQPASTTHDPNAASIGRTATLNFPFEEVRDAIYARMVKKVGDRRYWEQWAKDVADIAERQVARIERLISEEGPNQTAFNHFLTGLQRNINPSIQKQQAIDMLAQHLITKPVFQALFEGYSFVEQNPISVSMQQMLDLLEEQGADKDNETLQRFYESVRKRAAGIDNAEGKQRIIIELYDKFFKEAFPKMVEQLGIVYTPIEIVDFIIHSVDDILKKEFDRSLSDENVHILDPFTGTGTFMTRLLQSGLIDKKDLPRKYTKELHANEIVLLAYYIASVNIETAYHDALGADSYQPFDGICLTDTFQLGESDGSDTLFMDMFPQNSARVQNQKNAPLRVIMGNPPYSVGQTSANDNAQNQNYPNLNKRISETYAKNATATNKNSLYDSYIKAFRWATDRLDDNGGIIAFVSNGAWLDGNATEGFRKTLEKEFSSIYVFNLRGNQRTSGELSRKEGGKIFGSGSRTPIAITVLIKKPQ